MAVPTVEGCRCPPTGAKGDRTPSMVSCPLLTPLTFLWTRLPSVARLKARGPQGRSVLQGSTLDGSEAFRSRTLPPCTGWPRTVMRGELRKVNSGPDSVLKSARRTEPSPRNSRFAAHLRCVSAKEGLGESRGGKGTIRCPCPLLPPPPGGGNAYAMSWRISPVPGGPVSPAAASRRNGGTASPLRGKREKLLFPLSFDIMIYRG